MPEKLEDIANSERVQQVIEELSSVDDKEDITPEDMSIVGDVIKDTITQDESESISDEIEEDSSEQDSIPAGKEDS